MINALIGGALIGIAVSLMLIFNGRVTGISGIIAGAIEPKTGDTFWRFSFLGGLLAGGILLRFWAPNSFTIQTNVQYVDYVIAGLLVGFGTLLGNGCTSGHGVCGISRFSIRSILATLTFIFFGALSVAIFKMMRGSL
jgi:uncharacterized membrane protein YedE/YeeE